MAPLLIPLSVVGSSKLAPSPYWISTVSTTTFEGGQDILVDSSNNIFRLGFDSDGVAEGMLLKYDFMGNPIFIKKFQTSSGREAYISTAELDSSNNLYAVGCAFSTNSSRLDYVVIKFNSSGTILWQKALYDGTNSYNSFHDKLMGIDSSGNVYGMTQTSLNPSVNVYTSDRKIVKFSTNGTLITQRHLVDSRGREVSFVTLKIHSSTGNIHVGGSTNLDNFLTAIATIFKTNNSASATTWSKELTSTTPGSYSDVIEIDVDSVGNVYATGYEGGLSECFIVKFDPSGNVVWQVKTNYSAGVFLKSIRVDRTTGDIYVSGRDQSGTYSSAIIILKFNSSGVLQWQRAITNVSYIYTLPISISSDSQSIHLGADKNLTYNSDYNIVSIRLPTDGSLLGNHSGNGYVASSYSFSSYSGTWANASMQTAATSTASTTFSVTNATYVGTDVATYNIDRVDIR